MAKLNLEGLRYIDQLAANWTPRDGETRSDMLALRRIIEQNKQLDGNQALDPGAYNTLIDQINAKPAVTIGALQSRIGTLPNQIKTLVDDPAQIAPIFTDQRLADPKPDPGEGVIAGLWHSVEKKVGDARISYAPDALLSDKDKLNKKVRGQYTDLAAQPDFKKLYDEAVADPDLAAYAKNAFGFDVHQSQDDVLQKLDAMDEEGLQRESDRLEGIKNNPMVSMLAKMPPQRLHDWATSDAGGMVKDLMSGALEEKFMGMVQNFMDKGDFSLNSIAGFMMNTMDEFGKPLSKMTGNLFGTGGPMTNQLASLSGTMTGRPQPWVNVEPGAVQTQPSLSPPPFAPEQRGPTLTPPQMNG